VVTARRREHRARARGTAAHATRNGHHTARDGATAINSPFVDKQLRTVRLFYGTNRERTAACAGVAGTAWSAPGACRPNAFYGGLPAVDAGDGRAGLEVGTLAVTFPAAHERGKLERPLQVWSFSLREEDPDKDVVVSELRSFGGDQAGWARELKTTGRDQAFIYVHGFATGFDEAARRAAQLAYDLDFDLEKDFRGVPMVFSWPSRGAVDAYGADYDASFEAIDAFNRFLDVVKKDAGIRRVHVIAHSMGNRVVTEALYQRGELGGRVVDQLVLAAPDVWASRFKNRFLTLLPKLASRVTLYVSDNDRALIASSEIRSDEPRAGQVAGGLLQASKGVDRFDAINASSLRADFLGHSYYASHASMLSDIHCLLKGTPPQVRPLLVLAGVAWQFRPPEQLATLDPGACLAGAALPIAIRPGIPWPWIAVAAPLALALLTLAVRWRRRRTAVR
jgi:esterase/lipase superfamily enzyme